jgi:hypothetical protein
MKHLKKLAIIAALSTGIAFANPNYNPFAYDPSLTEATVTVPFASSAEVTVNLESDRLINSSERIALDYGFEAIEGRFKIKEVNAPEGLKIELLEKALNDDNTVGVTFEVSGDNIGLGSYPVTVTLENTLTGETTTFGMIVLYN